MNRFAPYIGLLFLLITSCDPPSEQEEPILIEELVTMYDSDREEVEAYILALNAEKVHIFDHMYDYDKEVDPYLVVDISNSARLDSMEAESLPWAARKVAQSIWSRTTNPKFYKECKVWVGTTEEVLYRYTFLQDQIDFGIYDYYYESETED
ncbi:MAG: hypothetical protein AAFU33_05555 [Bacteroidota bacterium]